MLNGTLKKHTEKFAEDEDFVTKTRDSLFVDDFAGRDDNAIAATKLHAKLNTRFESANFNFRKWRTNDPMLRSLIADETMNCESLKILGVKWNDRDDNFIFDLDEIVTATIDTQQALTKRIMLRTLSSFFDPLGILQPIIVGLKIMFQEACKFTKDWDQVLSNDIQQKWFEHINEIIQLKSIKVNRTYTKIDPSDPISNYEFHGFSDASDEAYGACIYLKSIHESGNIQTSLITSKSKVAPIKLKTDDPETTPRLELLGNLLLSRLTNTVVDALKHRYKAERIFYWTDSTATLSWIKTNKETKAFIENRINEIRKRTDKNSWFHVKGENNPADIITRKASIKEFANNTLWWNGPAELRLTDDEQQNFNINNAKLPPPQQLKKQTSTNVSIKASPPLINIERFNCLNKLYRVTAYAMRFVNNFVAKFNPRFKGREGVLSAN